MTSAAPYEDTYDKDVSTIKPVRMVKVAPGPGANFWKECLEGSYICVGWDDLGDLRLYPDFTAFKEAFAKRHPYKSKSKMSAKANELWKFFTLQPGDLVAANDGASKILGIGTVLDPAYEWRTDRSAFYHTIRVQWDTSLARAIPKQGSWPLKTVSDVSPTLAHLILSGDPLPPPTPNPTPPPVVLVTSGADYQEPAFADIETAIQQKGMLLHDGVLRRYHLALKTRGFVILSGISGTGKTWLAEEYAWTVGAEQALIPVAPNWTTNEDLLGYLNPFNHVYHDTEFSNFLRRASQEFQHSQTAGQTAQPYHVILDEMNLARVEYYFALFLSLMEARNRYGTVLLPLGDEKIILPPNLVFIGTVNSDETTHGFADKVYDRAQVLEMTASRKALSDHIGTADCRDALLGVWDAVHLVAPFAFRVVDEIKIYSTHAATLGVSWQEALDEQLLQKVLPKLKGTDSGLGVALQHLASLPVTDFPRTAAKAAAMYQGFQKYGFASFF